PVERDGERAIAGEDEQPEQERAFLTAPEGREGIDRRQGVARVGGDVAEGEVVPDESDGEYDRGDGGRAEAGEQRVPGRVRGPTTLPVRETVPVWPARLLGWRSGVELPPITV